jgi:uncharacterized protein (DUF3820 family)
VAILIAVLPVDVYVTWLVNVQFPPPRRIVRIVEFGDKIAISDLESLLKSLIREVPKAVDRV